MAKPVNQEAIPFNGVAHANQFTGLPHDLYPQSEMAELLAGSVRRCEYFASDETDEFQITREDGTEQGIFKVWATPVIAVLDTERLDVGEALNQWSGRLREKPLSLFESLEQWRAFSAVSDRRLQQIFESRPMPAEPDDSIAEQFNRLAVAFAYSAPFYHLEALVADSREDRGDNPIDFNEESAGGRLDAVAMLLPAAFSEHVTADRLDWNGLDWETLQQRAATMKASFEQDAGTPQARQFVSMARIAALANIEPEEVLFAANVLQFIPADVGGKRDDLPQAEALATLEALLSAPADTVTTGLVAKDANALIRFLNWTPAFKSPDNFAGKYWAYDAVCRTAADLVETIKAHPDAAFDEDFARVFSEHLAPQLDGLDAASAKGRFILQLLSEGKFKTSLVGKINQQSPLFTDEISSALAESQRQESLVTIGSSAPTMLVGGKATGLRRAMQLFGHENVLGGHVLTSEAIGSWLGGIESVRELVNEMESISDPDEKVAIGEKITHLILASAIPESLVNDIKRAFRPDIPIVLRSSSFDEDVDIVGPAPGVYESAININSSDDEAIKAGLKEVVSSFFSDKAVSFRELKGLRHKPLLAVLAQEFQPGVGGSVFIQGGEITLNTAPSPSQINDIAGAHLVEELTFAGEDDTAAYRSSRLNANQVTKIAAMAKSAEAIYGPTDLEFVIDPGTQAVRLLQMRTLERPVRPFHSDMLDKPDATIAIGDLNVLPELNGHHSVALTIGENIDLEKFQGTLFRWIITNRDRIQTVTLAHDVPATCHFANIIESLGIRIRSAHN